MNRPLEIAFNTPAASDMDHVPEVDHIRVAVVAVDTVVVGIEVVDIAVVEDIHMVAAPGMMVVGIGSSSLLRSASPLQLASISPRSSQ